MDWFDFAEHGAGHLDAALRKINIKQALVIGVESDALFPLSQQQEIADHLHSSQDKTQFHALPSIQGHDAFLVDRLRFAPLLEAFFQASF